LILSKAAELHSLTQNKLGSRATKGDERRGQKKNTSDKKGPLKGSQKNRKKWVEARKTAPVSASVVQCQA